MSITNPVLSEETDRLLYQARWAGLKFWPGQRVTYQGQPGTVRHVRAEIAIDLDGPEPGQTRLKSRAYCWYWLWLDSGEHVAQVAPETLSPLEEPPEPPAPRGNLDDVRQIDVTLFTGNLLNDTEGVNIERSAHELARMIEQSLAKEYPRAVIAVDIQDATGEEPRPVIDGDIYHDEHWRVDELIQNTWATWDWIVADDAPRPDSTDSTPRPTLGQRGPGRPGSWIWAPENDEP